MIDQAVAQAYFDRAVDNVQREYPYAPWHVLRGPADLRPHRERHPAFYGSFDWHSSVHQHWLLVRLLDSGLDLSGRGAALDVLAAHLSADNLARETEHLRRHPRFERPYGWAWLLLLDAELHRATFDGADRLAAATALLADEITPLLPDWVDRLTYPVRHGTHANTAFALLLMIVAAEQRGRAADCEVLREHALRLYSLDHDVPVRYEPSGEDFLSPALMEAHLMSHVLDEGRFGDWLAGFLPATLFRSSDPDGPPASFGGLLEPPTVADPRDYRVGHLIGLGLSRAWNWWRIGAALDDDHPLPPTARRAATAHASAALPMVLTSGYGGDHWLATFAVLAYGAAPHGPLRRPGPV